MISPQAKNPRRLNTAAVLGVLAVAVGGLFAQSAFVKPAESATYPVTKAPTGKATATFAAGCFWSMEAIFKQLKGVEKVEPGYSGGNVANPSYEQVETSTTGHAETINIIYDPSVISYHDLLEVLLTVRNPTTPNQQGPDVGPQYRSIIFYRDAAQKKAAEAEIKHIADVHLWPAKIVTQVAPFKHFYRAEDYHLNYYNLHPDQGYCSQVIAPEIAEFRAKFKTKLKS